MTSVATTTAVRHDPWPGPVAYTEDDAEYFVGRDREADNLISLLHAYSFVLLHAPSGAGKSSLVSAGVIPHLGDGFEIIGRARVLPSAHPEGVLGESKLIDLERNAEPKAFGPNPYEAGVIESLGDTGTRVDYLGLEDLLIRRASVLSDVGEPRPTLLVLDQFEEILHRCEDYADQQERFMDLLQAAVDVRPNLRVLFVARDDHLGPILRLGDRLTNGYTAQMHLDRMKKETARQVLIETAEKCDKRIDDRVVADIVDGASIERYLLASDDASGQEPRETESRFVGLVTLQVVAKSLWEKAGDSEQITMDHLRSVGNVAGALEEYYEDSVREAADASRTTEDKVREFFEENLISESEQRQLVPVDAADQEIGAPAFKVLVDERAVVRRLLHGPRYYELCHDSFVAPIRDSNQLKRRRDRARKQKRNRWIAALAALGAITAIVVALSTDAGQELVTGPLLNVDLSPDFPPVPSVVGLDVSEAENQLVDLGLEPVQQPIRSALPVGQVLQQEPAAGIRPETAEVILGVSAGVDLLVRDDSTTLGAGEEAVVEVLANDEGRRGTDALTVIAVSQPDGAAASIVDNHIVVTATEPGEYLVTYTVSDGETTDIGELAVIVTGLRAEIVASATEVLFGESITFRDVSSGTNGRTEWDFGDGHSALGGEVTHRYEEPGLYVVTLAVAADDGEPAEAQLEVEVVGATRLVTVLGNTVNIRSDPVIADDSVVAVLTEAAGTELEVLSEPDAGWYRIASGDHTNRWIFGSLIFPQSGDLRVAVTVDGQPAQLYGADGEPLPATSHQGPFVLVTAENLETFEVLLADGTYAFADRQAVALVEDLSIMDDR